MTTNVVDSASYVVASDSRWSFSVHDAIGAVHAVFYVDDTRFDKIEVGADYSFIFAGSSALMAEWKKWSRSPGIAALTRPRVENNFSLCMLDMQSHDVVFEHGQKIVGSDHRFAGTGAVFAYQCWQANRDPLKCVVTASEADLYSGGAVRNLELGTGRHNVSACLDHRCINEEVLKRGFVMYPAKGKKMDVAEAVATGDPRLKKLAEDIARGEVHGEAPSGLDTIVWTDADVKRLDEALARTIRKRKA